MPRKSNKQKAFGTKHSEGDTGNTRRMSKKRSDREKFLKDNPPKDTRTPAMKRFDDAKTRRTIKKIKKRINRNTAPDPYKRNLYLA